MGEADELAITPYWRDVDMEFLQHFLPWQSVERNGAESFGLNNYSIIAWPTDWQFKENDGVPGYYIIPIAWRTNSSIEMFVWTL